MEKKKKQLWIKVTLSIVIVLVIIAGVGYITLLNYFNKTEKVTIDTSNLNIQHEEIEKYENNKEIKNIALFGIDSVDGVSGRSDSIMIATIDTIHSKLKLTSIMRDSYVNIEDRGMDKINHAYAFGGPELAIKTINENFGLNIDSFMSVNFTSLPKIIDTLDGVEIAITDEEISHIAGINSAGTYKLNGDQALSYSRIRYATGGDYKRTERQRVVLDATLKKILSISVSAYPSTLNNVLPYIQTNMSDSDILGIGTKALGVANNGLMQERFPQDGYCEGEIIDGIYYLTFNRENTKKQFMDYIFDDKL